MECKKPGEWRLFGQPIAENGGWLYIVGRQRNTDEVLHSGNIEYRGQYTSREEAEELKQKLIRGEVQ